MRKAQPLRRLRQHDLATGAAQDLEKDRLGHSLNLQERHDEAILLRKPRRQFRIDPTRRHAHGAHFRRVVAGRELGGEAFVQGQGAGFGAGVVDEVGQGGVGGHGGDGHDHAVVGGDHGGEEFADQAEVGEDVDGEGLVDGGVGAGEDGSASGDAGVVDEDGGGAVSGADGGGGFVDGGGGGDVAVVEVDVGCCWGRGELVRWGSRGVAYCLRRLGGGCPGPLSLSLSPPAEAPRLSQYRRSRP